VKTDKLLWVREHSCPACGFELDRDASAAWNIPNYCCSACDRSALRAGASENTFRCQACGQLIIEAIDDEYQRVRRFFGHTTARQWDGILGATDLGGGYMSLDGGFKTHPGDEQRRQKALKNTRVGERNNGVFRPRLPVPSLRHPTTLVYRIRQSLLCRLP
jgi:predicted RNA-binding Zn-ribbon protein involved in translation (DUF1610 family)